MTGLAFDSVLVLGRWIGQATHQQVVEGTAAGVVSEQVAPGRVGGLDGTQDLLRQLKGLGHFGGSQLVSSDQLFPPHGRGTAKAIKHTITTSRDGMTERVDGAGDSKIVRTRWLCGGHCRVLIVSRGEKSTVY